MIKSKFVNEFYKKFHMVSIFVYISMMFIIGISLAYQATRN